jgi:TonB family protein
VHNFAGTPVVSDVPRTQVPTRQSLVVLTRDGALAETLKGLGTEHTIVTVNAESHLAGELVGKHMGVAIIDTGAVATAIERLTGKLKEQFPDLVLIVAGSVNDQTALGAQITSGAVYRFLHKPVSEQRVKLFVEAAWRRHGEALSGVASSAAPTSAVADEQPAIPRNMLFMGGALVVALLAAGGWFLTRKPAQAPTVSGTLATPERDEQLESLLTRAAAARAAGAGQNAADLYKQALRRNGNDPRPAAGVEKVLDKLLSAAESQLGAQHLDEAQKLIDQARAIKSDHVRVAFLSTQLGKARERFVLAQARQAASSGNIEAAIAVLDGANKDDKHPAVASEARQEPEQKKLDDRVNDYLGRAADRLRAGQLVEPAQDNARFFIESARAFAPNDPQVRLLQKQLEDRLVLEARTALSAGNAESAQRWIDAATDSGVSRDEIAELTREAQRIVASAKAAEAAPAMAESPKAQEPQDSPKAADITKGGPDTPAKATDTAQRVVDVIPAATLELARYVPPKFPVEARERGLSGWVDVLLVIRPDGSVSDVSITGAEPAGLFEQAAVDAVRKWRYKPVERNGHAVDQRARLRMKFALDK